MSRLIPAFLLITLISSPAWATHWKDYEKGYALVSGKNALTVQCEITRYHPKISRGMRVYYSPSCPGDCYAALEGKLASFFLDGTNYPAELAGGDTSEFFVRPQSETTFSKNLAKAKEIRIYSSEVTPHNITFGTIDNPEVIGALAEHCN